MRTFRKAAILLVALAFVPSRAVADEFHYVNKLVGERGALMGGAYTAISDDPSGCYYNPAGIVRVPHESFSLSASLLEYQSDTRSDFFEGRDVILRSQQIVPTFSGLVRPLGRGRVCFSIVVTDSTNLQAHKSLPGIVLADSPGNMTVDLIQEDTSYLIGPSYARSISRLSVGASLFLVYRKSLNEVRASFLSNDGRATDLFVSAESRGIGLAGMLGGLYNVTERLSLGLVYRPPGFVTSDRRFSSADFDGPQGGIFRQSQELTTQVTEKIPQSTTVGGAYRLSESVLISSDLSLHAPVSYGKGASSVHKSGTINGALGTEVRLSEAWRLLGGLFTNRTAAPRDRDRIHIYGISAGAGYESKFSTTSLGLVGSGGTGDYIGINGTPQDLLRFGLAIVIASSIHF